MVHMRLMVDVWNVHISWLMYRTHQYYGRWSEYQEPTMHRPETTEVRLELIFPLFLQQPSSKLRKTLIST